MATSKELKDCKSARIEALYGGIKVKVDGPCEAGDIIEVSGIERRTYFEGSVASKDKKNSPMLLVASTMGPGDGRIIRCVPWMVVDWDKAVGKPNYQIVWLGSEGKPQLSRPLKGDARKIGFILDGQVVLQP